MAFDLEELRRSAARFIEISERARALHQSTFLDSQKIVNLNSPIVSLLRVVDRRERLIGNLLPKIADVQSALTPSTMEHALTAAAQFSSLATPKIDFAKLAIAPTVIERALFALDRWPRLQRDFHFHADRYADIALKLGSLPTLDDSLVRTGNFIGSDIRVKSGLASLLYESVEPIEIESDPEAVLAAMRVRLTARDSSFGQLFDEAEDALRGTQRGRARMILLALREIAMHLLNDLAPTQSVRAFTADPDHFMTDGKPKHKAQLAYVCRSLPSVGLEDYLSSGRRLTRKLFAETSKVVHAKTHQVQEQHIQLLLADAHELVAWLLDMADLSETKH